MGPATFLRRLRRIMPPSDPSPSDAELRGRMVREQIEARGIRDPRVLEALRLIPREQFVLPETRHAAHGDHALPIGENQTISQPYMVALMTEKLRLEPQHRVLEIGTGSGYQTAVLAKLCAHVYTVERLPELSRNAQETIRSLGLTNVEFRIGDGSRGWPEEAPFDRILVTAGAPSVPQSLLSQLVEQGRMVIPTGGRSRQEIRVCEKRGPEQYEITESISCSFVPLIGEEGWEDDLG
jgi:protein-L-isoaspartate(D-aspartate) O-methyltransferase